MGILAKMFGRGQQQTQAAPPSATGERLDLLSQATRETLLQHGIPLAWIAAETLPARAAGGRRAMHLRLVFKRADPRLLAHAYGLQVAIERRLAQLDAQSASWLSGTSWRVDVPLGSECTDLPDAGFWTAGPSGRPVAGEQAARERLARRMDRRDHFFPPRVHDAPEFATTAPMVAAGS